MIKVLSSISIFKFSKYSLLALHVKTTFYSLFRKCLWMWVVFLTPWSTLRYLVYETCPINIAGLPSSLSWGLKWNAVALLQFLICFGCHWIIIRSSRMSTQEIFQGQNSLPCNYKTRPDSVARRSRLTVWHGRPTPQVYFNMPQLNPNWAQPLGTSPGTIMWLIQPMWTAGCRRLALLHCGWSAEQTRNDNVCYFAL